MASTAERLKIACQRRTGKTIYINTCPENMQLTSTERHEAYIRMRVRMEENRRATGLLKRAF